MTHANSIWNYGRKIKIGRSDCYNPALSDSEPLQPLGYLFALKNKKCRGLARAWSPLSCLKVTLVLLVNFVKTIFHRFVEPKQNYSSIWSIFYNESFIEFQRKDSLNCFHHVQTIFHWFQGQCMYCGNAIMLVDS